jgi:hypothetical protein
MEMKSSRSKYQIRIDRPKFCNRYPSTTKYLLSSSIEIESPLQSENTGPSTISTVRGMTNDATEEKENAENSD